MNPVTNEWILKAENDYQSARVLLRQRSHFDFDGVCFHAQQCAEKYMKAVLTNHDLFFAKTHDLIALLEIMLTIYPLWESCREICLHLTDFATRYRYPGSSADRAQARACIDQAAVIRKFARESLGLEL